jgi:hypothetical protein
MAKQTTLSEQELVFVHEYVRNGFNGSASYKVAYQEEDQAKASHGAYRLLKKPLIQDAIEQEEGSYKALARELEMDRKAILQELKDIIWAEHNFVTKKGDVVAIQNDGKTKNAAIVTLCKLIGDFSPEKKEVEFTTEKVIDTKNMTKEDIELLQAALLKEM